MDCQKVMGNIPGRINQNTKEILSKAIEMDMVYGCAQQRSSDIKAIIYSIENMDMGYLTGNKINNNLEDTTLRI